MNCSTAGKCVDLVSCAQQVSTCRPLTCYFCHTCSTPFVEYENLGPLPTTPFGKQQGTTRRVCVSAVYRRIAAHDGQLPFPQQSEQAQRAAAITTPRKVDTQNDLLRSVFSPVRPLQQQQPPQSPVSAVGSSEQSPQPSAGASGPCGENSKVGSSLSSGALRVLVPPYSPYRAPQGCATPASARGTPRTRCSHATATPAHSDAVVSMEAKQVIQQLLQPCVSERMAAMELVRCGWLNLQSSRR
jgi:hypothetical protein